MSTCTHVCHAFRNENTVFISHHSFWILQNSKMLLFSIPTFLYTTERANSIYTSYLCLRSTWGPLVCSIQRRGDTDLMMAYSFLKEVEALISAFWDQTYVPCKLCGAVSGEVHVRYLEKILQWDSGWALEQAAQEMVMAPKTYSIREAFWQCTQTHGLIFG